MKIAPDLLTCDNGQAVTAATWPMRRCELYQAIVPHAYGGLPPADVNVVTLQRAGNTVRGWPGVRFQTFDVRICLDRAGELMLTLQLWLPPGDGPFPVVLNGDGCWRSFNDTIVRMILDRGMIAASFDRTQAAADNPDQVRESGLYRLLPDATFGALAAWAWAYHRCIDALWTMDPVQSDAIAITGHSRGGKAVLLAGATDERIAVTNPNDSGCGGSALNRLKADGSEVIDSFFESRNIFWFGKGYGDYRGRDGELPYDQHFLHGLIAPRGLLVTEAYEDAWANPPGSYAACLAARQVYEMLGDKDKIGWSFREGGHAHQPQDFEALLDFIQQRQGHNIRRNFQRELFADVDWIQENPPTSSFLRTQESIGGGPCASMPRHVSLSSRG